MECNHYGNDDDDDDDDDDGKKRGGATRRGPGAQVNLAKWVGEVTD